MGIFLCLKGIHLRKKTDFNLIWRPWTCELSSLGLSLSNQKNGSRGAYLSVGMLWDLKCLCKIFRYKWPPKCITLVGASFPEYLAPPIKVTFWKWQVVNTVKMRNGFTCSPEKYLRNIGPLFKHGKRLRVPWPGAVLKNHRPEPHGEIHQANHWGQLSPEINKAPSIHLSGNSGSCMAQPAFGGWRKCWASGTTAAIKSFHVLESAVSGCQSLFLPPALISGHRALWSLRGHQPTHTPACPLSHRLRRTQRVQKGFPWGLLGDWCDLNVCYPATVTVAVLTGWRMSLEMSLKDLSLGPDCPSTNFAVGHQIMGCLENNAQSQWCFVLERSR